MIFTEFRFFFFFFLVFAVYWKLRKTRRRNVWLLICSYAFYAAWDWRFLSLILTSTIIDFFAGSKIHQAQNVFQKRLFLIISLCANLGFLGFFKYYNFFAESASDLLEFLGFFSSITTLNIILPVGISFYTFQTMSYSIDIYKNKLNPANNFIDFALFVSFFPQLVAGPIVRAIDFLPQITVGKLLSEINFRYYCVLFLVGYVKKACISDNLAPVVDAYFSDPQAFTSASGWLAVFAYTVQIYCDFSGYSDMAIACAGFLGYTLPDNFNYPYFASNVQDFWRRWHISLSTWLREYLYIPLGGNRGSRLMMYRNLMLTMLLGGLWHGASWTFVMWGGLHGTALILNRLWATFYARNLENNPLIKSVAQVVSIPVTFLFICLTWVFFRSESFAAALDIVQSCITFDSLGDQSLSPHVWLVMLVFIVFHWLRFKRLDKYLWASISDTNFAAIYAFLFAVSLLFVPTSYTPFIYFQF